MEMRKELINQYSHFWRIYRAVCSGFDRESWTNRGFGLSQPDRLALHILQSTMFYVEDTSPLICPDGTPIDTHAYEMEKVDLPDAGTILFILEEVEKKTAHWIKSIGFDHKNEKFPWTGETAGSVALFLLRHSHHHLGEMNALLNDQLKGKADDHFAGSL